MAYDAVVLINTEKKADFPSSNTISADVKTIHVLAEPPPIRAQHRRKTAHEDPGITQSSKKKLNRSVKIFFCLLSCHVFVADWS